jgi:signal transduction histidine kinase
MRADPDKLRQIVLNLLSNAIKFTEREGAVSVVVALCDDWVQVSVKDSGPGIPPDHLRMVFEPFTQTEYGSRVAGGTGLGLSISRDFAVGMKGKLEAESELGKGSTFTVSLPRANS